MNPRTPTPASPMRSSSEQLDRLMAKFQNCFPLLSSEMVLAHLLESNLDEIKAVERCSRSSQDLTAATPPASPFPPSSGASPPRSAEEAAFLVDPHIVSLFSYSSAKLSSSDPQKPTSPPSLRASPENNTRQQHEFFSATAAVLKATPFPLKSTSTTAPTTPTFTPSLDDAFSFGLSAPPIPPSLSLSDPLIPQRELQHTTPASSGQRSPIHRHPLSSSFGHFSLTPSSTLPSSQSTSTSSAPSLPSSSSTSSITSSSSSISSSSTDASSTALPSHSAPRLLSRDTMPRSWSTSSVVPAATHFVIGPDAPPIAHTFADITPHSLEEEVLMISSVISEKVYLPWTRMDADPLHSLAALQATEPYTDPEGHLLLTAEQSRAFSAWKRPLDFLDNGITPSIFPHHHHHDNNINMDNNSNIKMDNTNNNDNNSHSFCDDEEEDDSGMACASVTQGVVGDCSFLAAMIVAAHYERIHRFPLLSSAIFPQVDGRPVVSPSGKYWFRMFWNGIPRRIQIDDYLPVGDANRLLCAFSSRPGQLWVSLFEKAYMKVRGGYSHGGGGAADMRTLFGWFPEVVHLDDAKHFDADLTWIRLAEAFPKGHCMIVCSTGVHREAAARFLDPALLYPQSPQDPGAHLSERTGLLSHHAYACVDVVHTSTGARLLKLQNPWHQGRWKGKWGVDDAARWTPALQRELGYDLSSHAALDTGVFYMQFEDVCAYFQTLHIAWNVESLGLGELYSFHSRINPTKKHAAPPLSHVLSPTLINSPPNGRQTVVVHAAEHPAAANAMLSHPSKTMDHPEDPFFNPLSSLIDHPSISTHQDLLSQNNHHHQSISSSSSTSTITTTTTTTHSMHNMNPNSNLMDSLDSNSSLSPLSTSPTSSMYLSPKPPISQPLTLSPLPDASEEFSLPVPPLSPELSGAISPRSHSLSPSRNPISPASPLPPFISFVVDEPSYANNPQYELVADVPIHTTIYILVERHVSAPATGQQIPSLAEQDAHALFWHPGGARAFLPCSEHQAASFSNDIYLLNVKELHPGAHKFTLVVCHYNLEVEMNFSIHVCATYPISFRPLVASPSLFSFQIPGSWYRHAAAGPFEERNYLDNPAWRLEIAEPTELTLRADTQADFFVNLLAIQHPNDQPVDFSRLLSYQTDSSGPYRRHCCVLRRKVAAKTCLTVVASTFQPGQTGEFVLSIDSSTSPVIIKPLVTPFTSFLHRTTIKGVWKAMLDGGARHIFSNPAYDLHLSTGSLVHARLQITSLACSPYSNRIPQQLLPSINVSLFRSDGKLITSSGNYVASSYGCNLTAFIDVLPNSLPPFLVVSTFQPQIHGTFELLIFSNSPLSVVSRRKMVGPRKLSK